LRHSGDVVLGEQIWRRQGPHLRLVGRADEVAFLAHHATGEIHYGTPEFWRQWKYLPTVISYVRRRRSGSEVVHYHRPELGVPVPETRVLPRACPVDRAARRHHVWHRIRVRAA
jgi:hypothetical protein